MNPDSYPILNNIFDHLIDVGFKSVTLTSQRRRAIMTFSDKISNHYVLMLKPVKGFVSNQVYIENFDITPSSYLTNSLLDRPSYSITDAIESWQGKEETDLSVEFDGLHLNWNFWSLTCSGVRLIGLADLDNAIKRFNDSDGSYHWTKSLCGYPDIDACTHDILQNLFGSTGIAMSQSEEVYRKYAPRFVVDPKHPKDFIHPVQLHHPEFDHLLMLRIDGRLIVEDNGCFYTGIMEGETIKYTPFFQNV